MKILSNVVLLSAFFVFASAQIVKRWNRRINELVVNEFVYIDNVNERILMSASDSSLKETKYLQSISLHDFKAKDSKGLVALKVFDNSNNRFCFISDVANSFANTKEEAIKRGNEKTAIPLAEAKKYFEINEKSEIKDSYLKDKSPALAEFCNDVTNTYRLYETEYNPNPKFASKFFHTLCFWYPFPIIPLLPQTFPWPFFHPILG